MFVLPFFQWLMPREQYDCPSEEDDEDEEEEGKSKQAASSKLVSYNIVSYQGHHIL